MWSWLISPFRSLSHRFLSILHLLAALSLGLIALSSISAYAQTPPAGYITICKLGETCSISKPSVVAFGSNDRFVYKSMSGTFICDVPAFNLDPLPGNLNKTCSTYSGAKRVNTQNTKTVVNQMASGIDNDIYVIVSKLTGQVLEVQDYSVDDGADIIQSPYRGSANQRWSVNNLGNGYVSIRALHSRKSIDVEGWSQTDGADVQQVNWLDSWNQHWAIQAIAPGSYSIVSRFSGMALDVYESNHSEGADVRMWTYWGGTNQLWELVKASDLDEGTIEAPEVIPPNLSF